MPDERERVADELRRVREGVRERALLETGDREARLPSTLETRSPERAPSVPEPAPSSPPPRPDGTAVNASWDVSKTETGGGFLGRLVRRLIARLVGAQVAWNAHQVQLDNEILGYIDARLDATHRHYDQVLGIHGRHLQDSDERHLILQEELVAHVHDLVKRIDLVLAEGEKGRLSLEYALRDVRRQLVRLEERLDR